MGLSGEKKIKGWIVVFMTPFGPFRNYSDARSKVQELAPDMNLNLCIFPVPAAVSECGHIEIVSR